jgi:ribosomal protein S12 methylthiotransferase
MLRFLEEVCFDRVGAFVFSPEEGTPAAAFSDQVTKRTKNARLEKLMSRQAEISLTRQNMFVGRELDVMIDIVNYDGSAEGRSFREAPEVDGLVELASVPDGISPGDFIKVVIKDAFEHDLTAEMIMDEKRSRV